MKNKILLLLSLVFIFHNIFAEELWNDFTDDMTEEEVIKKAKSDFNLDTYSIQIQERQYFSNLKINIFSGNQEQRNDKFMLPDTVIECSAYIAPFDENDTFGNIRFYLFNDKLYAVYIRVDQSIAKEFVQKATDVYGKKYTKIDDYSPAEKVLFVKIPATHTYFRNWDFNNKEIFIRLPDEGTTNWDTHYAELYVISKNHYEDYKAEIKRRNDTQKQKEADEKQNKIDSIKF